ncbi:hypothetical protein QQZ08_000864 [Neonectria magnoliae]|uniref:Uncharacterized protein n=1 Tax=Neonectria magnoliae TaxID=2732573 RepID=A0ABR1IHJ8_9HYPO
MLLAILGRYIYTRRALVSFRFRYGKSSNRSGVQSRGSTITELRPRQTLYDRWLILRLAVAFVALGTFQLVTIMSEMISQGKNNRGNLKDTADLSLQQAKSDFVFFLPGATPPLVAFIVFGTTRPFREYLWAICVPTCLKGRLGRREPKSAHGTSPSQGSRFQELHIYNPDSSLGYSGASSVESGMMLSSFAGRREDDVVPILEVSAHESADGKFHQNSKVPQSV